MSTTAQQVTFVGHSPVLANADYYIHLAAKGSEPGARMSLCGYSASQLREATRRDLSRASLCASCIAKAWGV